MPIPFPAQPPRSGTDWFAWGTEVHRQVTYGAIARRIIAAARDDVSLSAGNSSGVTQALGTTAVTGSGAMRYPMEVPIFFTGGVFEPNGTVNADGSSTGGSSARNRVGDPSARIPPGGIEFTWINTLNTAPLAIRLYSPDATTAGQPSGVKVWIDGKPLTDAGLTRVETAMATTYLNLTPGTAGIRRVRIQFQYYLFGGMYWDSRYNSLSPAGRDRPKIAVVGDSWSDWGDAGIVEFGNWTAHFREMMNCNLARMGIGGTGYVAAGFFGPFTDATRKARLYEFQPDLVIVQGSQNDANTGVQAGVSAAATGLYADYKTNMPNTPVIAIGPPRLNVAPSANHRLARDSVGNAAAAASNVIGFVDPMGGFGKNAVALAPSTAYTKGQHVIANNGVVYEVQANYTSNAGGTTGPMFKPVSWITGTGKTGTLVDDGSANVLLDAGGEHLTANGNREYAIRVYDAVTAILATFVANFT